ncbi:hypothetical protein M408DRAFT_9145 [Serendipita vermifera MAFF 305830]|uniref:Uncharacterized protein n=1 Tax=Serendipita vermifera MAFF 305830 TaxID=933852 RepID=A0A0C3ASW5_SERVB|nr:hypothetical protein M408DRAFT_9145 [Serendipita vermifera MAFF 305830]
MTVVSKGVGLVTDVRGSGEDMTRRTRRRRGLNQDMRGPEWIQSRRVAFMAKCGERKTASSIENYRSIAKMTCIDVLALERSPWHMSQGVGHLLFGSIRKRIYPYTWSDLNIRDFVVSPER